MLRPPSRFAVLFMEELLKELFIGILARGTVFAIPPAPAGVPNEAKFP
jgi:hypothetical protein